jgi:hypothetical protein
MENKTYEKNESGSLETLIFTLSGASMIGCVFWIIQNTGHIHQKIAHKLNSLLKTDRLTISILFF